MRTEYGIQMYSLRDVTEKSMYEALKSVAKMGYKYIEFAGFFDNDAETIEKWLDELGLVVSGTHTPIEQLTPDNIDSVIEYHKAIGCDNLIVPACDWSNSADTKELIEKFNMLQKKLAENGIKFGYHNHSREFYPTPDGVVFEDELIKNTDIELEIDTFWLYNAGFDVISYLEKNKSRISVIHLKDGIPAPKDDRRFDVTEDNTKGLSVGQGEVPIVEICDWANKNGVLMVVESEGLDPTGTEEVKRCIDYLRTLD